MTADVEDEYIVAQASEPVDENGCLINAVSLADIKDEIIEVERGRVDLIDVSPRMMVSIAAAMIPFLENDDANRACSGRQYAAAGCAAAGTGSADCGNGNGAQNLH